MIYPYGDHVLVLLADGSLYQWNDTNKTIIPELVMDSVDCIRVSNHGVRKVFVILTIDGRFFVRADLTRALENITALVNNNLKTCAHTSSHTSIVPEIYMYEDRVVIRTEISLCLARLRGTYSTCYPSMRAISGGFKHRINLVSFGYRHGFMRTDDNRLYKFGSEGSNREFRSLTHQDPYEKPILFSSDIVPEHIHEIVCGPHYTLFLMIDGTVNAHKLDNMSSCYRYHERIVQLQFSDRTYSRLTSFPQGPAESMPIAKIIAKDYHIFYITIEGLCYYSYTNTRELGRYPEIPYGPYSPVILKALADYYVENAYTYPTCERGGIVIQYDEGKLCLLNTYTRGPLRSEYADRSLRPKAIDVPGNELIVSVTHACNRIPSSLCPDSRYHPFFDRCAPSSLLTLITTDQGHVYQKVFNQGSSLEKVQFFDDSPVLVEGHVYAIPSARSCLDD